MKKSKSLYDRFIYGLIMMDIIVFLFYIKKNTDVCEYLFSRGINRIWIYVTGFLTSILPFSIFELLIIVVLISLIVLIVKIIKKRNLKYIINKFSIVALIFVSVFVVYTVTATMNYNRKPLDLKVGDYNELSLEKEKEIFNYFINEANTLADKFERDSEGNVISPYKNSELIKLVRDEYYGFVKDNKSGYFPKFIPKPKPILNNYIFSSQGIMGLTFLPTVEANYNLKLPAINKPALIFHELSHSLGVMREDDANLMSCYLCLNSENDFIKYSGYLDTISQIYLLMYFRGVDKKDLPEISENLLYDLRSVSRYFDKYSDLIQKISDKFNDLYLKIQGEKDGVESYNNPTKVDKYKDKNNNIIIKIEYSRIQKIYFDIYFSK